MSDFPFPLLDHAISKQMNALLLELDAIIAAKTTALEQAPKGSIHILKKCGRPEQFFLHSGPRPAREHYLKKSDPKTIRGYLQKRYDNQLLKYALQEAPYFRDFLAHHAPFPRDPSALTPDYERELSFWFEPNDLFLARWESQAYPSKPFRDDAPEFYTEKGERVRSKSELLIANMLLKNRIPYRYECPLRLNNGLTIHPDFTLLNMKHREEIYLEHFGMLDDRGYLKDALERITNYQRSGYYLGRQLLISYETGQLPLNIRDLENTVLSRLRVPFPFEGR